MTFPVLLGAGKRIFDGSGRPGGSNCRSLRLRQRRRSSRPMSPPARSRPAPSRPRSRTSRARATATRSRKAPGDPTLYAHPFSVLLLEGADPARTRTGALRISQRRSDQPGEMRELKRHWPFGKFPVLLDDGEAIAETTASSSIWRPCIPGPNAGSRMGGRPAGRASSTASSTSISMATCSRRSTTRSGPQARRRIWRREGLKSAAHRLRWFDANLPRCRWAAGDAFTLADCAAAPALFYADWVEEIGDARPRPKAYRAGCSPTRRCSRVEEARVRTAPISRSERPTAIRRTRPMSAAADRLRSPP